MEIIEIIYEGLKVLIAFLAIVIIISYMLSKARSKRSKWENSKYNNIKSYPHLVEKASYSVTENPLPQKINLRYIKSSNYTEKKPITDSFKNKKARYSVINEVIKKEINKSAINFYL